ncbi:MAG: ABC transporter permease subunit [Acidilobus sp.]
MRLTAPYVAYIVAFGIIPFAATFALVGVDYHSALVTLSLVPVAKIFENTLILAVMTSTFGTLIGLLAAVAVDMLSVRYQRVLSLLTVLPHTVPFVSAALIWSISLYGGGWGWFTYIFHIPYDPLYLSRTALWGVILVSVWGAIAFPFIIIYATLRSIPPEIRENSMMDNVGLARYYGEVAIPLASKAILIAFIIELAFSFGAFDAPYVLTGGGPGYATTTLGILTYYAVYNLGSYSAGALIAASIALLATAPAVALFIVLRSRRTLLPSVRLRMPDPVFKGLMLAILAVILFFNIMPVYWMFLVAFRPNTLDFRSPPVMLPIAFTGRFFMDALRGSVPYIISSVVVSIAVGVVAVFLASGAAYEIARGKAWGWLLPLSIYLYVLPPMAFVIPLYIAYAKAHLLNTWWALIMAMPLGYVTYALWLMNGFFVDLPKAYDEVAAMYNIKGSFRRLILPLSRPVLLSTFMLATVGAWNALFYPLIFSATPYNFSFPPQGAQTMMIYALTAIQESTIDWGMLASLALVAALPPMVIDLVFLSLIARGSRATGLKFL